MTPCEELGYKVGDEFVVTGGTMFTTGDIIVLIYDDGTSVPEFKLVGTTKYPYKELKNIRPVVRSSKPSSTDAIATSESSQYIGSPTPQNVYNVNTGASVSIVINVEVKGKPFELNRDEGYKLYKELGDIFEDLII